MDRKFIEFLVKVRDGSQMIADATNDYIDSMAPSETKETVAETSFTVLKFEAQQGSKLGFFEIAFKANSENSADKWQSAYDLLTKANATIKDRYHGKDYEFAYWLFGEGKIYRQKLKEKAA